MMTRIWALAALILFTGCATTNARRVEADLLQALASDPRFETLTVLIKDSGVAEDLPDGPLTIFAPTNQAFERLPPGAMDAGRRSDNRERLRSQLAFHIVPGKQKAADLKETSSVETIAGYPVVIERVDEKLLAGNAVVIDPDIESNRFVVHAIDQVLAPPREFFQQKRDKKDTRRIQPDQLWW